MYLSIHKTDYKNKIADRLNAVVIKNEEISAHDMTLILILKQTKNLNPYINKEAEDYIVKPFRPREQNLALQKKATHKIRKENIIDAMRDK